MKVKLDRQKHNQGVMQQAPFARGWAKRILGDHFGKVSSLDRQDLDARLIARGRVGDLLRRRGGRLENNGEVSVISSGLVSRVFGQCTHARVKKTKP